MWPQLKAFPFSSALAGDADQQLMFLTAARSGDADTVRRLCCEAHAQHGQEGAK